MKKQIFNTFSDQKLKRTKQPPILPKAEKINASLLFSLKFEQKKQPQKPKPRSYFKSNTPVCAILSDRTGQEMQDPDPT